jgi:hypothetical protein
MSALDVGAPDFEQVREDGSAVPAVTASVGGLAQPVRAVSSLPPVRFGEQSLPIEPAYAAVILPEFDEMPGYSVGAFYCVAITRTVVS